MPEQPGRNSVMYLQIRSYSVLSDFMAHNKNMWRGGGTIYDQHILGIERRGAGGYLLFVLLEKSLIYIYVQILYIITKISYILDLIFIYKIH